MAATPAQFTKAPWEELDYTADYTAELSLVKDTISSSVWTVPSNDSDSSGNQFITLADGVTVSYIPPATSPNYSLGGTFVNQYQGIIILAGGTLGKIYRVQNNIVTAGGRRYARQMLLTIAYR